MCLQLFFNHAMLLAINCTKTPMTNHTNSTLNSTLNTLNSTLNTLNNTLNTLNSTFVINNHTIQVYIQNTSNVTAPDDIEDIITSIQSTSPSSSISPSPVTEKAPASYQEQSFNDPMIYVAIIVPIAALVLIWFIAAFLRGCCKPCKPNVQKKQESRCCKTSKPDANKKEDKQTQCCCSTAKVKPVRRDTQHVINPV